jgi:hypothetical protein
MTGPVSAGARPSTRSADRSLQEYYLARFFTSKELFASALWLPSPAVYLSMQGDVGANQGSGTFIVSGGNGHTSGGGTFTMIHKQKAC